MSIRKVNSRAIQDGAVIAADVADGSIVNSKLGSGAVTNAKILDGTINSSKLDSTSQPYSFKNRIINGDMRIDQRNAGAVVTGNDAFPVDRFKLSYGNSTGAFSAQQSTIAPAGFISSLKYTTTTADASLGAVEYAQLYHVVEGLNVADLGWGTASAQPVTLSFWCRSSSTGTFGGAIRNSAANRSYPFSYTISAVDTWEYKSITIAGDTTGTWLTTNGVGMYINIGMGVGSSLSGTAGSWAAANYIGATGAVNLIATLNATFYITGVQLEKGSTATSFDYRPYGTELSLCQRYYQQVNGSGGYSFMGMAQANSSTSSRVGLSFQSPMRSAPSFTSSATGTFTIANASGNLAISALSLGASNNYGAWLSFTTGTTTTGYAGILLDNGSSSAYLGFSSEL